MRRPTLAAAALALALAAAPTCAFAAPGQTDVSIRMADFPAAPQETLVVDVSAPAGGLLGRTGDVLAAEGLALAAIGAASLAAAAATARNARENG